MRYLIAGFALVSALATTVARAELIVNGSFENYAGNTAAWESPGADLDVSVGNTEITGWTVTRGMVDYIGSGWAAAHGSRSLDLAGNPGGGGVSQSFATVPGARYRVEFDLSGNPDTNFGEPPLKRTRVLVAGQTVDFFYDVGLRGNSFPDMRWQRKRFEFVARGNSTTLEFLAAFPPGVSGPAFTGPALDNVSVKQVQGMVDNADGTVTDPATGLTWMRCALGQTWSEGTCSGTAQTFDWAQATAQTSTFAGHADWRLPNVRELQSIVDRNADSPAIDPVAFPATPQDAFWSATPAAGSTTQAWYVWFGDGFASSNRATDAFHVRLVRGGGAVAGLLDPARPTSDYVDHGDGTVTHTPTGLTWQRCARGQIWTNGACSGTPTGHLWSAAVGLASTFAGNDDWRLPTARELESLIDYTAARPAANAAMFPGIAAGGVAAGVWSDTVWAGFPDYAWHVYFEDGQINYCDLRVSCNYSVLFVRGGTSSPSLDTTGGLATGFNLLGNSLQVPIDVVATFGNATTPVPGISATVVSVWKWDATNSKWQFHSPQLTVAANESVANARSYDVLTTIDPQEGFWVNVNAPLQLPARTGLPVVFDKTDYAALVPGFNLIAIADTLSPSLFNRAMSQTDPGVGVVPLNVTSLWAWDATNLKWFFYSANLEAQGGLGAVKTFAEGRGYQHFEGNPGDTPKTLGPGVGFWVNRPAVLP